MLYTLGVSDSAAPAPGSAAKPSGLRERMRATVRAEVSEVALRLFAEQGFDRTTVDQIAAEAGLSRASLFRYFGTKEDIVLGHLEQMGERIAQALAARPERERPWKSLRQAFNVVTTTNEQAPQQALSYLRMLAETPSLRARHWEKQLAWQNLLVPEIARRVCADPDQPTDPRPNALVSSALACLDAAANAWVAAEGAVALARLLDEAMDALNK